jgi:sugar lactone lactonase YvrE
VTEYRNGITRSKDPDLPSLGDIAVGRDGRLWFTEPGSDGVGAITTGGKVTEYRSGITTDSHPNGIATGPDGNVWFTEPDADQVGRATVSAARKVTVTLLVAGKGTISGAAARCSDRCAVVVSPGARLVFHAKPARGYRFAGWHGVCSGRGACTFRAGASLTLVAAFRR